MGGLALLIAVPLTVVLRDGSQHPALPKAVSVPAVSSPTVDAVLGVRYRLPKGWRERKSAGAITLESSDRATGVTISAPAPNGEVSPVLADAVARLRASSRTLKVLGRADRQRLGGLTGASELVELVNSAGVRVRTLLTALAGRQHTYLVQSYTAGYGKGAPLSEAQVLLNGLRLTG